jgi:TonB family protein
VSPRPRAAAALALSTLAHAALLAAALLSTVRARPGPRPLAVRLLSLPSEALASFGQGTLNADRLAARPAQKVPPRAARKPKAVDVSPAASALELVPPRPFAQPELAGGGPHSAEGPASEAVGAPGSPSGAGPARDAAGGGPAFGARLGELHRRLAEAAARCYPAAARRFRLTGQVPLHFCLDAAGVATALSLEGSTGSAVLDRSALECVLPGAQPLSGFEGCFLVPVRFGG